MKKVIVWIFIGGVLLLLGFWFFFFTKPVARPSSSPELVQPSEVEEGSSLSTSENLDQKQVEKKLEDLKVQGSASNSQVSQDIQDKEVKEKLKQLEVSPSATSQSSPNREDIQEKLKALQ